LKFIHLELKENDDYDDDESTILEDEYKNVGIMLRLGRTSIGLNEDGEESK
jgi:hypothetical protein